VFFSACSDNRIRSVQRRNWARSCPELLSRIAAPDISEAAESGGSCAFVNLSALTGKFDEQLIWSKNPGK
jgi:hypothetical protein